MVTLLPLVGSYDAVPGVSTGEEGGFTVAAVQGDVPGDGTDVPAVHREITANHVALTEDLAADVEAGRAPRPDLVVWPENSTAVDPFTDVEVNAGIVAASDAIGVPILVGGMVDSPREDEVLNQGIVWRPQLGGGDRYTKRHPVPYGEYIPFRGSILPDTYGQLRLIPRDMARGASLEPLRVDDTLVADAICFDVAYDDVVHGQLATRGRAAHRADQQRDVHQHRPDRPAVRDQPAAGRRDRAVRRRGGHQRRVRHRRPRRARGRQRRPPHPGRARRPRLAGPRPDPGRLDGPLAGTRQRGYHRSVRGVHPGSVSSPPTPREQWTDREGTDHGAGLRMSTEGLGRVVMVMPTYNEVDNLEWIVGRMRAAQPTLDLLVVDDGSPDGTGEVADRLAAADPRVTVLHRTEKAGLGAAYLHGFRVALDEGYDVIGEMDADGSHQPEQLHRLLEALRTADLVIGSRYVPGGSVVNWPLSRHVLSRGGNLYVRLLLGISVKDATAGFRLFRREALEKIDLDTVQSTGTCSRPTWPTAPCGRACGSSRCPSSSSSGCAATPR